MAPTTIMDNSLMTATGEVEKLTKVLRWRPGMYKIPMIEENNFYIGLNLKGKEFKSIEEVNEYMRRLTDSGRPVPKAPPQTPFEKAQALIYETIDAPRKKRVEKCREALTVYPGCADAWVILSEYEKDPEAKRKMLEEAVKAGETSLRDFSKPERRADPGDQSFWAGTARPYMRARLALAKWLHEAGDRDRAIEEYRSLLELNPQDNQGVRYLILSALLETGTEAAATEAAALIRRTRDASPMWAWADAFLAFKSTLGSPSPGGSATATRAYYGNPHVVRVLSGEVPIPKRLPETSEYGMEDEAVIYGALALGYWKATPGALQWLQTTVDRITAGLPAPFGMDAPWVRERIARLWRASGNVARAGPRGQYYAKALQDHPEFGAVWLTATATGIESLTVGSVGPFGHVGLQAAVEEMLDGAGDVPEAMRTALDSVMRVGLSRHEAVHLLGYVYLLEWSFAVGHALPLDAGALVAHLRYVTRLVSGQVSPDSVLVTPGRNDPCPCGSGRKFKKCCGRDEIWPIPQVVALAREIKASLGKVRSHRNLGLSPLFGNCEYASLDELAGLPAGHPLVTLDNTAAVAEALMEKGYTHQAFVALRDNIELARTLDDGEHLVTALYDAMNALTPLGGYESETSQYACELARLAEDPREASCLWSAAGEAFMTMGKMQQAEEVINRAMSVDRPHPGAKLVRADYLAETGRRDEAMAAYREAIKDCESSIGPEYEGIVEQAEGGLRRLERAASGIRFRTTR